ncbi:MAG: hypothetical protein IPQ09_14235 [Myxococcales bacterium]|nr:hypothetical protein [Myxococcales bacterium]
MTPMIPSAPRAPLPLATVLLLAAAASCIPVYFPDEGPGGGPPPDDNGGLIGGFDPGFRMTYPAAGSPAWERESQHAVMWETSPKVTAVPDLYYSLDDAVTWKQIEVSDEATGRVMVDGSAKRARLNVPATGGTHIRVRLSLRGQNADSAPIELAPSQRKSYSFTRVSEQVNVPPRDGACGVVHNGAMWLLGGWNPGYPAEFPAIVTNDVWRSEDGANWTRVKPNTFIDPGTYDDASDWSGRHTMGCTSLGGKMFIVGSDPLHLSSMRDVWSSTDGAKWQRVAANTKFGTRVLQQTFSFQDKLWIVSGQTLLTEFTVAYPDVWSSLDGATWTRVHTEGPLWAPRAMIHGEPVFKGRMWLVSGGLYEDPNRPKRVSFDDVWSSADGVRWRRDLEHTPFAPRYFVNVATYDDRLWVLGGARQEELLGGSGNLSDVFYTSDGSNWYELVTPKNFEGRHSATAWAYKGALFWGVGNALLPEELRGKNGLPPENQMMPDMWKIVPAP